MMFQVNLLKNIFKGVILIWLEKKKHEEVVSPVPETEEKKGFKKVIKNIDEKKITRIAGVVIGIVNFFDN